MSLSLDTLGVWSMKLKPYGFPCEEVLCHLDETDALIDTKYKTPWSGTDSLQTLQEKGHLEQMKQVSLEVKFLNNIVAFQQISQSEENVL